MDELYGKSMKEMSKNEIKDLYGATPDAIEWTTLIPTSPKCVAISLISLSVSAISGFVSKSMRCI